MKKQQFTNPFDQQFLDPEERLIEEALERGEFESVGNLEDTKNMLAEAAKRYKKLNASKPITIRINQLDLIKVKAKAIAGNVPYQTLLGSLIHQYAEGKQSLQL
ncbi:MAG: hypothetical protein GW947_00090 [Candidatus Pacebacteria bacterium]|nr:hypothetical protein [Candidatus Paceibacterota bacterium]